MPHDAAFSTGFSLFAKERMYEWVKLNTLQKFGLCMVVFMICYFAGLFSFLIYKKKKMQLHPLLVYLARFFFLSLGFNSM